MTRFADHGANRFQIILRSRDARNMAVSWDDYKPLAVMAAQV